MRGNLFECRLRFRALFVKFYAARESIAFSVIHPLESARSRLPGFGWIGDSVSGQEAFDRGRREFRLVVLKVVTGIGDMHRPQLLTAGDTPIEFRRIVSETPVD